ncbi:MAG: sulfatase-like hydrolase/transferase [Patescibacteria group bacterium]|nr:sulfatase-like hydrolase/transferase [Patescibacteria group bacterium]
MKKNIVFITIDCLRNDSLGVNNKDVSTPFLDSMIRKGVYFPNAITASPWSGGAGPSIFTGTYPLQFGGELSIKNRGKSFVEVFKENGFTTIGIHSNPFFTADKQFDKGFDYFYDWYSSNIDAIYTVSSRSQLFSKLKLLLTKTKILQPFLGVVKKVLKKASIVKPTNYAGVEVINQICKNAISFFRKKKQKAPTFLWLHYMDAHEPITIPESFQSPQIREKVSRLNAIYRNPKIEKSEEDKKNLKRLYHDSIGFLDTKLKEIFDYIDSIIEGEIIYVITADHGQSFGENGHFGHGILHSKELLNVPLIIYSKNLGQERKYENFVPLQAIGNVMLELAQCSSSIGSLSPFLSRQLEFTSPKHVISEEGRSTEKDFMDKKGYRIKWDLRSFGIAKDNYIYSYYSQTKKERLFDTAAENYIPKGINYEKRLPIFRKILKQHLRDNHSRQNNSVVDNISI